MKKNAFLLLSTFAFFPLLIHAEEPVVTAAPHTAQTDREVIKTFYQLLNNTGSDIGLINGAPRVVGKYWQAEPRALGGDGVEGFIHTFMKYHLDIPDLLFTPQEILKVARNRYVVRSVATGTAMGDFLGLGDGFRPGGRFVITTIEIHTLKKGKIIKTYHVEDWKAAMAQITPP
jgi:predicted ester cyclase